MASQHDKDALSAVLTKLTSVRAGVQAAFAALNARLKAINVDLDDPDLEKVITDVDAQAAGIANDIVAGTVAQSEPVPAPAVVAAAVADAQATVQPQA